MDFLPEKLDKYVVEHTSPESELLYDLNRQTHLKILQPRMLSGHLQGRTLSMLSKMIRPKNILEIGTYTGYSAICLSEGLQDGGKLITIDKNAELEEFTSSYFDKAGLESVIDFKIGDATEIIPTLDETFDLIFIDADKPNYPTYYKMLIDRIPSGAYILIDNVLWSGKVIEELNPNDLDTKAILEINDIVQNDERVENVLMPIRDGLMVIRKK